MIEFKVNQCNDQILTEKGVLICIIDRDKPHKDHNNGIDIWGRL